MRRYILGLVLIAGYLGAQTAEPYIMPRFTELKDWIKTGQFSFTYKTAYGFSNGLSIDNSTNNTFKWTENSEDLIWTFGSNAISLSSSTGVTSIDFGTIDITLDELTLENGLKITNTPNNKMVWLENSENLVWTFGTNAITVSSDSGVASVDYGTIDLATDALDLSEGNITNAGQIDADLLDADGAALQIGDGDETLYLQSSDWTIGTTGDMTGIGAITADGIVSLDNTTDATSTVTGSFHTDGGAGIAKSLFVGGVTTFGTDGSGVDVIMYSTTADDSLLWDASAKCLIIQGTSGTNALAVNDGNVSIVNNLDVDGTANLDDVDIDGSFDITANKTGGANTANTFRMNLSAGETFTGTTGHQFKVYDADNTVVHDGGEHCGVYVNMKLLSAMASGGKSVLYSGHNYGSGGDYQIIDAGMWLYGNFVDAWKVSGGSIDTGLDLSETTVTGADIHFSWGGKFLSNAGSPNGSLTAPINSLCVDTTNHDLYINTDGGTTWAALKN